MSICLPLVPKLPFGISLPFKLVISVALSLLALGSPLPQSYNGLLDKDTATESGNNGHQPINVHRH